MTRSAHVDRIAGKTGREELHNGKGIREAAGEVKAWDDVTMSQP